MTVFFFFKQKTAYEVRISDWSSDVCSSDLHRIADTDLVHHVEQQRAGHRAAQQHAGQWCDADPDAADPEPAQRHAERPFNLGMGVAPPDHGEADDREAQRRATAGEIAAPTSGESR